MATRAARDRPNIVLINCDDLGYGDLGCYGSLCNTTPTLDRLAAQGMRFTDFCMASSVCSPSRAAMLTGSHPVRTGVSKVLFPGDPVGLSSQEVTIAELLSRQGYATKLVGKWHCGDQPEYLPTRHGFDSYYGIPYSNDMGIQRRAVARDFPPLPLLRDDAVIQQQPDQAGLTERYMEECVTFIRRHRGDPFFLYLAHMYVHLPIYTPERFRRDSRNGRYGAAVACIDWSVRVLVHALQRLGLAENTLIIFTSDNGSRAQGEGGSNGTLRGHKGQIWEGGFRVPCIAHWPGTIAPSVCAAQTSAMDLFPTFAALAGAPLPDDRILDGHDRSGLLLGDCRQTAAGAVFSYYAGEYLCAIRHGRWKLHVSRGGREEICQLYDLASDLGERHDQAAQQPQVVRDLMARADRVRADLGDKCHGATGSGRRHAAPIQSPAALTTYHPDHPYIIAEYDLSASG